MQKLDFTENINTLIEKLKSETITEFIDRIPINGPVDTNGLTPLIIESKSNFDKIEESSKEFEIINVMNGQIIYHQKYISELINQTTQATINKNQKVHLFISSKLLQFYNFHFSLIQSAKIANEILFADNKLSQIESDEIIVFRILVGEGNLDLSTYGKILKLIDELIQILGKIYGNQDEESGLMDKLVGKKLCKSLFS
jgi:hypothetical protein